MLDAPLRHEKWASSFDVRALKAATARMNERAGRFDTELRSAILDQQDSVMRTERALATASDNIESACEHLVRAYVTVRDAAAPLRTRTDGHSRAIVRSSDALMDVIECWSYDTDLHPQLQKVIREVGALAKLGESSEVSLRTAITALVSSNSDLTGALVEKQSKQSEYELASKQMAGVLAKAARIAGLATSDRDLLSNAFLILPKTNVVIQQLDVIEREAAATRDKYVVDPADIMCWTITVSDARGRITEGGTVEVPNDVRDVWDQRLDAVHDVVDQALAIPGAEW